MYLDILTDIKLLHAYSSKKNALTSEQERELSALTDAKKKRTEQQMLAENKQQKKRHIDSFVADLNDKIKAAGLSPDLATKFLNLVEQIKTHDVTNPAETLAKLEKLETQMKHEAAKSAELAQKEAAQNQPNINYDSELTKGLIQLSLSVALNNQTKLVRYAGNVLLDLAMIDKSALSQIKSGQGNGFLDDVPQKPARGASKKAALSDQPRANLFSDRHYAAEQEKAALLNLAAIDAVKQTQQKLGLPQTSDTVIKAGISICHPTKKRALKQWLRAENPQLAERCDTLDKEVAAGDIVRSLIRAERKKMQHTKQPSPEHKQKMARHNLFMQHYDAVLAQNNTTATDLLEAAKTRGTVSAAALMSQIDRLNFAGLTPTQPKTTSVKKTLARCVKKKPVTETLNQHQMPTQPDMPQTDLALKMGQKKAKNQLA